MVTGLQHVALVVSDLERARQFYGDHLGMEELPRPASFGFGGAWFHAGGREIHLLAAADTDARAGWDGRGPSYDVGRTTHVAFEVDDLQAEITRLGAAGVEPCSELRERGDGVIQIYYEDPDLHLIELFQYAARG